MPVHTQSEQQLESALITQLEGLGYTAVNIRNEEELLANLKIQLEIHNKIQLSDLEFKRVLNHLIKSGIFERAEVLRDKMQLQRDDGTRTYLEFFNKEKWCQNEYQITHQVSMDGVYKNRYDVTLLINGLPLVQIELKRRGLELKEAFKQIRRYQGHSFGASFGLFKYIQIFVISNGVNTKYYANNLKLSFEQTFFWSDVENNLITGLSEFASDFLEKCHLSKMIARYTVLNQSSKILMIMRPYQFYATEAIVERVKTSTKNGYIWHTTGSGKTLTSFKTSQILKELPQVEKVVFVVDRKDLDYKTIAEFKAFAPDSIDGTDNTKALVRQLGDPANKLIVTTLQKLNTALTKVRYESKMETLKHQKIVFIFDECHRSQFGQTHKKITTFFENAQLFGFTGTPILAKNAIDGHTTTELFHEPLHKYLITDAIKDENVLRFSIEYVGKYTHKPSSVNELDIEVEDIDSKELLESTIRAEKIVDYIIANHSRKTNNKEFSAMFCVSSVQMLTKYYDIFRARNEAGLNNLKVATIFSYGENEEPLEGLGDIPDSEIEISEGEAVNVHSRDKLESYIRDYNQTFGTNYTTRDNQSFYNYYQDIGKRVQRREIDILLVVNMFLTGFDSPRLNTLYVDKNLRYHGLIQAFSRTNRIFNKNKPFGNIVCFRNLKAATDEAVQLFSNKEALDVILVGPMEDYLAQFNLAVEALYRIVPTVQSVDDLVTEEQELAFIKAFRELMRLRNTLSNFADFQPKSLAISPQEFEDFKSKYLDIHATIKQSDQKNKTSILEDVDFELELIHRDEINVNYILSLLTHLKNSSRPELQAKQHGEILQLIDGEVSLRSKRELIEKFINQNLTKIKNPESVPGAFKDFINQEKEAAIAEFCRTENLQLEQFNQMTRHYLFSDQLPQPNEIIDSLNFRPGTLDRSGIIQRVKMKIVDFVEKYVDRV